MARLSAEDHRVEDAGVTALRNLLLAKMGITGVVEKRCSELLVVLGLPHSFAMLDAHQVQFQYVAHDRLQQIYSTFDIGRL